MCVAGIYILLALLIYPNELRCQYYACIKLVMAKDDSYRLPTTTVLTAFDCAARLGSFAGAAKALGISQPAVSRHIANLEKQLGASLFQRSRTGVRLTEEGQRYHEKIATGLGLIKTATSEAIQPAAPGQVMIACSETASHYLLMPRHNALQQALGEQTQIGTVMFNSYSRTLPLDPVPDVILDWDRVIGSRDRTVLFREAVRPVCSPEYAATHEKTLSGPVSGWSTLAFLQPGLPNEGWASWEDWFRAVGHPEPPPRMTSFDNYLYSLAAAASGQGIALGWRRLVDQHLEGGLLVALGDGYVERDNNYCGMLTEQGRLRPIASRYLSLLQRSVSPAEE